jgi:hypothetical protein
MEWIDWENVIGPAVVAALISGVVAVVGFVMSMRTLRTNNEIRMAFDREQAIKRSELELDILNRKHNIDMDLLKKKADTEIEIAEKKIHFEKNMLSWKRKFEISERIISEFYFIRDQIKIIRRPLAITNPNGEEKRFDADIELIEHCKRIIKRLGDTSEKFALIMASKNIAVAVFGQEIERFYKEISLIRGDIFISAQSLLSIYQSDDNIPEIYKKDSIHLRVAIGLRYLKDDPIEDRLNRIIEGVELICLDFIHN